MTICATRSVSLVTKGEIIEKKRDLTKCSCLHLACHGARHNKPTKMCVLVYTDSALHNADPDEEGSDDEWLAKAKKGIRVRFQHDVLVCVVAQVDLKKTIWSVCSRSERVSRCI